MEEQESGESRSVRRYLYLLLYSPGYTKKFNEPINGNTRLQKIMHDLSGSIPALNVQFRGDKYGAYSPALNAVQTQDIRSGFIDHADSEPRSIRLTRKGVAIARRLWDDLPQDDRELIADTKDLLNEMSYQELMSFSYSTFPETTGNSRIKPVVESYRLDSAVSLFKRERVSIGKAASIAGMSLHNFIDELEKRGIPAFTLDPEQFDASLKFIEEHL